MTATDVWLRLTDPDVPRDPYRALDLVMEVGADGRGCERDEALRLLHEAAAEWLLDRRAMYPGRECNPNTRSGNVILSIRMQRLDRECDRDVAHLRSSFTNPCKAFGALAELAVSILRELTDVHEVIA